MDRLSCILTGKAFQKSYDNANYPACAVVSNLQPIHTVLRLSSSSWHAYCDHRIIIPRIEVCEGKSMSRVQIRAVDDLDVHLSRSVIMRSLVMSVRLNFPARQ